MKKSKKYGKLKKLWSKVKKPLIISSFILNFLFILISIVGCISSSNNDDHNKTNNNALRNYLYGDDLISSSEPVFPTDLTGSTWELTPRDMTYVVQGAGTTIYNLDVDITCSATYNGNNYIANKNKTLLRSTGSTGSATAHNDFGIWDNNGLDKPIFKARSPQSGNDVIYQPLGGSLVSMSSSTIMSVTLNSGSDINNSLLVEFLQNNAVYISGGVLPEPPEPPSYNEYDYVTDIFLSDDFVPSVYVAYGGDLILNGFGARMQSATTFFLDLNGFTFISNGQTFNRVRIAYMPLPAGAPYVTDDGSMGISTEDYTDYVYCLGVFYQFVDENDDIVDSVRVVTNRKKLVIADNANINAYDVRPPFLVWVNQNYRSLKVIEDSGLVIDNQYLQYENMSAVQLLQVTSNVTQNVAGMTNAFDLIRHAFESIQGILQMSIFPGVTIGLLMFIPLILTIIMVVIKLVKR